jgi:hypothetical protein
MRLPLLVCGLAFHAGLEWILNVQLFQWTITAFYLLFLQPGPRRRAVDTGSGQGARDAAAPRAVAAGGRESAKAAPVRTSSSPAA